MTARRRPATAATAELVPAVPMTVVLMTVVLMTVALAGCGSTRASGAPRPVPPAAPSLATSAGYPGGTWAVLVMGGSAAQHDDFWQVFVRPAGKHAAWRLATPLGAASNGGIAVAATGGPSLVAAMLPSQDLRFSPLSRSADNGAKWAQAGLLDAPLAAGPSALAGSPSGGLIALTRAGAAEVAAHPGGSWTRLATEHSVATSAPARSCGLTALSSAGYSSSGAALLAGSCSRGSRAGIFVHGPGGGWLAAGPALPPALAGRPASVLQLARAGPADVALLEVGTGRSASLLGAWSSAEGSRWQLSAPYPLNGAAPRSAAVAGRALGVLLNSGRAVTVTGPGTSWQVLPALPAGAAALSAGSATLAAAPDGGFQLLAGRGARLSVWSAGSAGWARSQVINVAIPYGSSG
ncbi:MAG TPA: hypothetical protein VMH35_23640 [Streptosporangiaceae bacterium]|nr:hypothetical protein [Streptosporangiaceae bacterium]